MTSTSMFVTVIVLLAAVLFISVYLLHLSKKSLNDSIACFNRLRLDHQQIYDESVLSVRQTISLSLSYMDASLARYTAEENFEMCDEIAKAIPALRKMLDDYDQKLGIKK